MVPFQKYIVSVQATAVAAVLLLALPATAFALECKMDENRTFGAALSDEWISTRIESAYLFDPKLNTFDVDVKVHNGVAHVIGYVPNEMERDLALKIAENARGVKGVVDRLVIDPHYKDIQQRETLTEGATDYVMSRRVKMALVRSPRVAGTQVGVDAYNGVVTLRGSVNSLEEKMVAEEIARGISEVKEVKNEIIVVC